MSTPADPDVTCSACGWAPDRRHFLRFAIGASIGALISLDASPADASALLPALVRSRRRHAGNPTYPIPAQDGVQIDRDNQVILVRWKESVFAFNLSCPHQNTALRWHESDTQFECPKHHSKYQPDGTFISGRATRAMDRFSVTRVGNEIVVNVNSMHKSDADAAGWSTSVIHLT